MRRALFGALVFAALAFAMPAEAGVSQDFNFDGCRWRSTADSGLFLQDAITETEEFGSGCRYLDADVRYFLASGSTATKFCATTTNSWTRCWAERPHHQSYSRASSWETDHWQTSGWWG